MSLLDEYGDRREKKGMKEILLCFIDFGESIHELSKKLGMSRSELEDILK